MWKKRIGIPLLIAVGMILTVGVVYADLKATHVVYAWDEVAEKYQNSNVIVTFNGVWVPFLHQFDYDNDVYPPSPKPAWYPDACPGYPLSTTTYAGVMEYGLYHEDNAPAGGVGFLESRDWSIVYCDRDQDGDFDNGDLSLQPATLVTPAVGLSYLQVITKDEVTGCTSGNCNTEIVTTLFVNMDLDCDNVLDSTEPLCFYAEAQTPVSPPALMWEGPLQARIATGGGEKTVNFNPREGGTTAVNLASFTARGIIDRPFSVALWAMLAVLGSAGVGVVTWQVRRVQQR
jgi:hypothetical protein